MCDLNIVFIVLFQSSASLLIGVQIKVVSLVYLDDIFDVLASHGHPCIMLGRFALLWIGVAVSQESVSVHTVSGSTAQIESSWNQVPRARNP